MEVEEEGEEEEEEEGEKLALGEVSQYTPSADFGKISIIVLQEDAALSLLVPSAGRSHA